MLPGVWLLFLGLIATLCMQRESGMSMTINTDRVSSEANSYVNKFCFLDPIGLDPHRFFSNIMRLLVEVRGLTAIFDKNCIGLVL